jgi:HlyD family secretion protein
MNRFFTIIISSFLLFSCNRGKTVLPEYKSMTEAVYASGKILPKDDHKIYSTGEGIINAQYISEGDVIKPGQLLFKIESSTQDARKENTFEVYQQALRNKNSDSPLFQELSKGLSTAKAKMENDSVNYIRFKNLIEQNISTKIEYDRAALAYKVSSNEYQVQKERYEKLKEQLSLDLKNSETQYKISSIDAGNYSIKSNIEGKVYEIYKKPGEVIRRNDPIAMVGQGNSFYVQLWIDESDVTKIKPGQELFVKTDLYKGRVFKAVVSKIYPSLNQENRSVRVDAEFVDGLPSVVANATAEANIVIRKKDKALTVPKSFLISEDSLIVQRQGKTKKVKIVKGIETPDFVEILSGVEEGTEIKDKL